MLAFIARRLKLFWRPLVLGVLVTLLLTYFISSNGDTYEDEETRIYAEEFGTERGETGLNEDDEHHTKLDYPADRVIKISAPGPSRSKKNKLNASSIFTTNLLEANGMKEILVSEMNSTKHVWPWGDNIEDLCRAKEYDLSTLPTATVIITFIESEQLLYLLRTVRSVVRNTPKEILAEIIILNDNSQKEDHTTILQNYISVVFKSTKIRLLAADESLGLIRARLAAAVLSSGDVIVPIDAHMEVQEGWLEPLLAAIVEDPLTMATSYLDWMTWDEETNSWLYKHGPSTWKTYFDWSMEFGFQDISKIEKDARADDRTAPIRSPMTIGASWAIRKDVFENIGALDELMEKWGGENFDMALRVWMCGGRVVNVPCSHNAHVEKQGQRNYRENWQQMKNRNYKRIVDVWFDEYKEFVYLYHPEYKDVDPGDLSYRFSIKKKCFRKYKRDFSWFLREVYPQLGLPGGPRSFAQDGVVNAAFDMCLNALPSGKATLKTCTGDALSQGFFLDLSGHLRFPSHVMDVERESFIWMAEVLANHDSPDAVRLIHWKNGWLKWMQKDLCLQATSESTIAMSPCDLEDKSQRWKFNKYSQKYLSLTNAIRKDKKKALHNEQLILNVFGEPLTELDVAFRQTFMQTVAEHINK